MANILLLDENTGALKAIVEGTEITAWRTAAASLVATQYLYNQRPDVENTKASVAIVGCGVQVWNVLSIGYTDKLTDIKKFFFCFEIIGSDSRNRLECHVFDT